MSSRSRASRPCVEVLEDRRLLTVVPGFDSGGNLNSITAANGAQTGPLTLTVQPGNHLHVVEGSHDYGTFPVSTSFLHVTLGSNTVGGFDNRLDLNNLTLTTYFDMTMGDTNDVNEFDVTTPAGGSGKLAGGLTFVGAKNSPKDLVFGELGSSDAARTINITGYVQADMGGGGADPNDGPPDLVTTLGNSAASQTTLNVGGNFSVKNATFVALTGKINGNLNIDSSARTVGTQMFLGILNAVSKVGGNLNLKTGSGDDLLDFQNVKVGGSTISVNAEGGDDMVGVTNLSAPGAAMKALLGEGDDFFGFADNASVSLKSLLVDGQGGVDGYQAGKGNHFSFPIKVTNTHNDTHSP